MEICSSGEKLKKIRNSLKISQKTLTQGIISIPMLSYIENSKLLMSEEIAVSLCVRLNEIAGKTVVSPQELLYSEKDQAKDTIELIIKNPANYSVDDLKKFKLTIKKYADLSDNIKFNSVIGSFLYNKYQNIDDSLFFLESVLDDAIKTDSNFLPMVILQLQRGYNKSNKWSKSINLFKILDFTKIKEKEIKGYILFNFGLAFHKEHYYEDALKIYKNCYYLLKKTVAQESCLNNIGFCYILKNDFSEAIDYFLFSLKKNNSPYNMVLCYSNLILCGIDTNNHNLIKNTIPKLEKTIETVSKDKRYQSYMCLGKGYLYLNDSNNGMLNFQKELELGINMKDHHFLIGKYIFSAIKLLELYESYDLEKFKKLQKFILQIPKEAISSLEILEIIDIIINKFPISYSKKFIKEFKKNFSS